jgi:hypothetical protein
MPLVDAEGGYDARRRRLPGGGERWGLWAGEGDAVRLTFADDPSNPKRAEHCGD